MVLPSPTARVSLTQEKNSYYILCTTTQTLFTTLYGHLHETKYPTIYSIVSTCYYILKLICEFYSWSCTMQCEPLLWAN